MLSAPPFKVGDRVRRSDYGMLGCGPAKVHTGVVKKLHLCNPYSPLLNQWWRVAVLLDGGKRPHVYASETWKLDPDSPMNRDAVCEQLVAAYHRGDTDAALLLADRIFELCGGSRSPTV